MSANGNGLRLSTVRNIAAGLDLYAACRGAAFGLLYVVFRAFLEQSSNLASGCHCVPDFSRFWPVFHLVGTFEATRSPFIPVPYCRACMKFPLTALRQKSRRTMPVT